MAARTSELHLQPANNFMEVSKAWSRHPHHVFLTPRSLSCLLGSRKPSSKCMCRRISFENAWKFRLGCTKSRSRFRIPVMSAKKGSGRVSLEGLCEVVWNIEADLPDGQLLYVSGEPTQLGCWQPHKAIRMFPTEHTNLWRAQVKMPPGNFKYNYFMTKERSNLSDMKWRTGPEVSLSVPFSVNQDSRVLVRDSWAKFSTARPPTHGWDSWIEDAYLAVQPSALPTDELETLNRVMNDIKEAIHSSKWKVKDTITCADDDSKLISYERDQPIEEPWLPLSSNVFTVHEDKSIPDISGHVEDDVSKLDVEIHNYKAPDLLPPADGSNLISKEDSVSTIILINSSICTMQRIAVLEDAKLVELLLEPVKTNVQCDSVYLGVVTKLVPHMGGAFVNIGSPRPSFMDIKQTREPFIFPPFRQSSSKEEENGSVLDTFEEEHPVASENESILPDVEEFISRDDLLSGEEHDIDDDFDTLEEKKHLNGSIVDHGEAETHFGNFLDLKNHLQAETTDGPLDSLISHLQDTNASINGNKWSQVRKGTKIIVQVVKEGLGTKGPTLTAYPKLKSRFWILSTRCDRIGVSKKVSGVERTRLRVIAKTLQPPGFGLTVRTVAAGHSLEELQKDLEGLLATWKNIREDAKSSALAADEGVEGAIPVILHRAMGQTLSVVQDYFNEKVQKLVVDSPRTYHEVTNYLQDIAPDLCNRVELHRKRTPLFDEFCIEEEINHILSKRVPLANGGSLVIEQTEALVSIDVNGGHVMFGQGTSQEKAILDVNLAAAKQIARELRLRDIGGIIVVDFIDMEDESSKRLVYEEMKEAVERDRSTVKVSELSKHGLMEITRKRVRPSVTFMISEPCSCCHATGRVEALETSFSKIEQEICRLLVMMDIKSDPENPKTWPRFILRVDQHMSDYLTSGKRKRLAILSSSLKVWLLLKVARGFTRGAFEVKPFTEETASKNQHQIAIQVIRRAEARTSKSGRKVTLFPIKKNKTSGK